MAQAENRNRVIPVTFDASRRAVDVVRTRTRTGVLWHADPLWGKQIDELGVTLHLSYYPGPMTDLFQHKTAQQVQVENPPVELIQAMEAHPAYVSNTPFAMYPGGRERQNVWHQGRTAFFTAMHYTAGESALEVPLLAGYDLDAYDKLLVNPAGIQNAEQARAFLRMHMDELERPDIETSERIYTFSPIGRFHNPEQSQKIKLAVWERAEAFVDSEPDFVSAVDETIVFDETLHRQMFFAGAAVIHDLFETHYELEELTGMM